MRLHSIEIENFRGVGTLSLRLDEDITVIIGRNGAGKTSVLDAFGIALKPLQMIWQSRSGQNTYVAAPFEKNDVRTGSNSSGITITYNLSNGGTLQSPQERFRVCYNGMQTLDQNVSELYGKRATSQMPASSQPLFVYYRQDRGFKNRTPSIDLENIDLLFDSSLSGPLNAITDLGSWWDRRDADEARHARDRDRNYRDPQLEAIRNLIHQIDSFKGISFSSTASPAGLYFTKNDGASVHVDSLSSGERSYLILLADLARRLQVIAPDKSLGDIPGIVLIDEIELNLHPAWQSQIIPTLRTVFKSCQFIITTHSPQVISGLESKHVRILTAEGDGQISVEQPDSTLGRSSNYLLEGVFGASERFPAVEDDIDAFNTAIDERQLKKAQKLLIKIIQGIEGDPPELLVFKKRLAKLSDAKNEG